MKNGDQATSFDCGGLKISVQINGIKKGSGNEEVTCEVGQIRRVYIGKQAEWSSIKSNLGTCLYVVFDVSVGNEPKIQVKTEHSEQEWDTYCPKSVELKINDMHFCGQTNLKQHHGGSYSKDDNSIIHDTTRGQC